MLLDQCNEITLRVAAESRNTEMRILREIILRACVDVGEIAAPSARYANLFACCLRVVYHQHRTPAFCSFGGTHHARRACANNRNIDCFQLTLLQMAPVHTILRACETEGAFVAAASEVKLESFRRLRRQAIQIATKTAPWNSPRCRSAGNLNDGSIDPDGYETQFARTGSKHQKRVLASLTT